MSHKALFLSVVMAIAARTVSAQLHTLPTVQEAQEPIVQFFNSIEPILENVLGFKFYVNISADAGYETQYNGRSGVSFFHQGYGLDFFSYYNVSIVAATPVYFYSITFQCIPFDVTPLFLALQFGQQGGVNGDLPGSGFGVWAIGGYSIRLFSVDTHFQQNLVVAGVSFLDTIIQHKDDAFPSTKLTVNDFFKYGYDERYVSNLKSKFFSFDFFQLIIQPGSWYNGSGVTPKYFYSKIVG